MAVNASYISTNTFGSNDIKKRELINNLIDIWDDEYSMFDQLVLNNKAVETANMEYFHFVNSSLYSNAEVKTTTTAAGAGATATIVCVGAASTKPTTHQKILFPNGVVGVITAVSADADFVLTVKPLNTADEIPVVTDGDTLAFPSNAYGEGMGITNETSEAAMVKRSNKVGIFKTYKKFTDLAAAERIELNFDGKDYYIYKSQHEQLLKHKMDISHALIYDQISNGVTDADGNVLYSTRGLRNSIIDGGGYQAATAGNNTIALSDFKTWSRAFDAARFPSELQLWAGANFDYAMDTDLPNDELFKSGGISYAAYGGKKDVALKLGVNSFSAFGRTWYKTKFKALEHAKVSSATGYSFADEAYVVPMNKIKTQQGAPIDRMRLRYLRMWDGKDSLHKETLTGGLAPTPTNNQQVLEVTYDSKVGLEIAGSEQFALLTV